jgi:hypothetical protein
MVRLVTDRSVSRLPSSPQAISQQIRTQPAIFTAPPSMGRAAVVAAFLLGLFLPAWTAGCGGPDSGASNERPGQVKFAWLRIMAFTDAPVVGADVRVYLHSQPRPSIEVPAATNNQGVFSVAVRSSLFQSRSRIRVTVSGGTRNGNPFLGHLGADAVLTDPAHQIVVVNPVTTLVSLLLEARPNLKLEDAKGRVRSFLGLPAGYDIGLAVRESSGYGSPFFSPTVMLTEAEGTGGLDGLEARLVQELMASRSAKHTFLNPMPKAPGGAAKFIAKNLAAGVLRYAAGEGVGWAIQATGLVEPDATADDIAALQQGLADLQSSVDALSSQVAQLSLLVQSTATKEQYNAIVIPAQALAAEVTGVQNRLQFFAQECPPLPEGSKPPNPSSYCSTEKDAITAELNDVMIFTAYEDLLTYVQDNPTTGFSGMLHLYSLWLAQSKAFFRPADSTKMQNLYDYWDTVLTAAANLKVELLHWEGEQDAGGAQLIALMGNPDSSPPTTGTFQANQDANLKLMFPPAPPDTVISTADHTMWALFPWMFDSFRNGAYPEPPEPNRCLCWYTHDGLLSSDLLVQGYAGFYDWLSAPTMGMWQAAVSRAPSIKTGPNWAIWLNNETLANPPESPTNDGFFYGCETSQPECYWTSTLYSSGVYNVVCLMSDRFLTSTSVVRSIGYPVRTLAPGEQYFWYQ